MQTLFHANTSHDTAALDTASLLRWGADGYYESAYDHEEECRRRETICQNLDLVRHLAKRFRGRGIPYEDLVQVGSVGLIKAVDSFKTNNGAKLTTFATHYIIGEIKHHFRDNGWSVKVPRHLKDGRAQVLRQAERLAQELDRSPTVSELAKRVDTTEESVIELMELQEAFTPSSLDSPVSTGKDDNTLTVEDILEDQNFEDGLIDKMSLDLARNLLTKREKTIVSLSYEYNMSQTDIAKRVGLSQMHVSRLLKNSIVKMRTFLCSDLVNKKEK